MDVLSIELLCIIDSNGGAFGAKHSIEENVFVSNLVFIVSEVGLFHVKEFGHEVVEFSEAFLGDAEICVFMIHDLIDISEASSEVHVIFRSLSSFQSDIVELKISVIDGGWFQN